MGDWGYGQTRVGRSKHFDIGIKIAAPAMSGSGAKITTSRAKQSLVAVTLRRDATLTPCIEHSPGARPGMMITAEKHSNGVIATRRDAVDALEGDSETLHEQNEEKSVDVAHHPQDPSATDQQPKTQSKPRLWRRIFNFVLSQWLLLGLGLVILLAWAFPSVGKRGGHIASQYTITYGAVIIIFFVSGLSLPFKSLRHHATNIRLHLIVQVMSFLVTSSVFFGIAAAASTSRHLEIGTLVGIIATGCLPTTIASNVVMTREAKGDEAATMVEVTLGNLLGPFITPLLLTKLYLPSRAVFKDWLPLEAANNLAGLYRHVMMQIGLSVFVPLFVGQVVRAIWPDTIKRIVTKYKLGKVGSVCLLGLVW
jgi:predicted Na+-dependent transporter